MSKILRKRQMTDEPNELEQDRAPASSLKSQPKFRLILIIAITAALIAGGGWYYRHVTYGQYMQSTDNAYVAADSVVVSSKVAGYVDAVLVSENGRVSPGRSEEHTSELQSLMRISYAVFCLKN